MKRPSSRAPQDLGLHLEAHITDLVEEKGATIGALEGAAFFRGLAGNSSMAIAKEFAFDEVFRDGGAVQLDEDAVAAGTAGVDGACDQLLAATRLAEDQHPAVGRRHQLDLLAQRLDRDALAGDRDAGIELAVKLLVLLAQPPRIDRILYQDEGAVERQRLLEKVEGAELGRAHRSLDRAVAGDDDDLRLAIERVNLLQHFEAIAVGKPDIQQHDIVGGVTDQHQALAAGCGSGDEVALFAQDLFQRIADLRLVVDDEDVVHPETSSRTAVKAGSSAPLPFVFDGGVAVCGGISIAVAGVAIDAAIRVQCRALGQRQLKDKPCALG